MAPGTTIGRYVVLEPLGQGAMGVVVSAYDPGLDRHVAIKVVRGHGRADAEGPAGVVREAQALAKVRHPNVVAVYDVGIDEDEAFIAMERVQGETLATWMRRGRHPWHEVLARFIPAARGLAAVHAVGLVHRDFKPDNVMVDREGHVRVMDFGLAHATAAPSTLDAAAGHVESTLTGATMGTPAYMAPEHHRGARIDARSDQFSFCVALYEGLLGRRPFRGESAAAVAFEACAGPAPTIPAAAGIPGWLARAVLKGLSRDPRDRHASMSALLTALQRGRKSRSRWAQLGAAFVSAALLTALGAGAGAAATSEPAKSGVRSHACRI